MKIQTSIAKKIMTELNPLHMDLANESSRHSRDPQGETHFKLLVVSERFQGMGMVERHRLVMSFFDDERAQGLHALTLKTMTKAEWEKAGASTGATDTNAGLNFQSPNCTHPKENKD